MPLVRIVTDSSACLPDKVVGHPNLRVVPIVVRSAQGKVLDGPDAEAHVQRSLTDDTVVSTVAPSAVDYLTAVDGDDPSPAVIVTPAVELAGMYRNAALAARLASPNVVVVDCRSAAAAHGLAVMAGLDAVDDGGDVDAVAAAVVRSIGYLHLVAAVAGGSGGRGGHRWTPPAGSGPRRGVFRLSGGTVTHVADPAADPGDDPTDRTDSPRTDETLRVLAEIWRSEGGPEARRTIVFHAGDDRGALRLRSLLHGGDIDVVAASPAMALHVGPRCVGVAWHDTGRHSGP